MEQPTAALAGFTVAVTAERRRAELAALLARRGARVVTAAAITIVPVRDGPTLHAATTACVALAPDVVVATIGTGLRGWLEAADGWGMGDELRAALGRARLIARGPQPGRVIRAVTADSVAGTVLEVRGHAVVIDGRLQPLAPATMAMLSSLAARPGVVVSRARLAAALPRGDDGHAVDMAVARLRAALGGGRHVQTVIKRGYRLRVDEPAS